MKHLLIVISFFFAFNQMLLAKEIVDSPKSYRTDTLPDGTVVYLNPDTFASFPEEGGEILKIIYQNLKLPNEIDSIPIGKIIVKMVITENGEITNVEVLYPPQELLAKEIIRVIQLMPNFIPAKVQGKNVASYFTMPIHINLTK